MIRRIRYVIPLVVLVLFAAGCSSSDDSDSDTDSDSRGERTNSSESLTQANFAERVQDAQLDAGSAQMTMTMDMGGQSITAEGAFEVGDSLEDSLTQMTMDMGAMTGMEMAMDMIMADGVMYMNMGSLTGDKYLRIDPNDPNDPMAAEMGQQLDMADPTKQFEAFEEITEMEEVGDGGTIDGVETTEYLLTLDFAAAMDATGQDIPEESGIDVPDTLEYTVFMGEDDLIRRMSFSMMGMTMTMEFFAWGESVDISAPDESEVTEDFAIPGM